MELIERYVHEVGRRLPQRQRADVEAELRSLLLDALEARAGVTPAESAPSEADQIAVLVEFGPPAEVAARYAPQPRYVIGPRLFDTYCLVVGIVLGALALAMVVATVVGQLSAPDGEISLLAFFAQFILQYINAAAAGLGFTTLVFFILERTLPEEDLVSLTDREQWDPRTLPPLEDPNRIQPVELIVAICFILLALVLFNFFPGKIGLAYLQSGAGEATGWHVIPVFSEQALAAYLPLWNIIWVLTLALDLVLLRQGRWRLGTRLADLGIVLGSIYVLVRMITGPALFSTPSWWLDLMPDLKETLTFMPNLAELVRMALLVALAITIFDGGKKALALLRARG